LSNFKFPFFLKPKIHDILIDQYVDGRTSTAIDMGERKELIISVIQRCFSVWVSREN